MYDSRDQYLRYIDDYRITIVWLNRKKMIPTQNESLYEHSTVVTTEELHTTIHQRQ